MRFVLALLLTSSRDLRPCRVTYLLEGKDRVYAEVMRGEPCVFTFARTK